MAFQPISITSTGGVQLRLAYDQTHVTVFNTSSGGNLTVTPSGGGTSITGTLTLSANAFFTGGHLYAKQDKAVIWSSDGTNGGSARATVAADSSGNLTIGTGGSLTTAATFSSSQVLTLAGLAITVASASGSAGFRLPHGAAPSSPTNGDMWTTTAGLYIRINGATVGPLS